jgi:drug/metabolite transporter (DMT)-like permease
MSGNKNNFLIIKDNTNLSIKYMLISSFLFAITASFAKLLSENFSSVEIAFFRCLIGSLLLIHILKGFKFNINKQAILLVSRGLLGTLGLFAYFYSIANMPLSEATTFSKTSPIFTVIFAYLFLKEQLNYIAIIAISIGFIGVIFIMGVDLSTLSKTDYIGLLSGILAGAAYASIRELRKYYDAKTIVMSFMFSGTIFSAIALVVANFVQNENLDFILAPFVIPTLKDWLFIIGLGVSAYYSQILMTKAYILSHSKIASTISYSGIIFASFLGFLLGDLLPSYDTMIGIVLIILSGILIQLKNLNLKKLNIRS